MSKLLEQINIAEKINLGSVSHYVTDKIDVLELSLNNYISTENMLSERGGITQATKLPNSGKVTKFEPGDTLTSNIRPYFKKIWQATKNGGCSNDVLAIRTNNRNELDENFLYYNISNDVFFAYSMMSSQGTKMPRGDKDAIMKYEIAFPNLPTQKKIAKILSAYDEKIENNNKIIKNLEATAQTIFSEWFVEFEFPSIGGVPVGRGGDYNSEIQPPRLSATPPQEGNKYKSSGGKMVDSEMGEIPEGWRVAPLSNIADIVMGQSPTSDHYNSGKNGLPFHQGVTYFGDRYPSDVIYSTGGEKIAEENDILISVRAPVGRINIVNQKTIIGRGLSAVRSKNNQQCFLLYLLKTLFHKEDLFGGGSVFPSITKGEFEKLKVIAPKSEITLLFDKKISNFDLEIKNLIVENVDLKESRNQLLAKLI